MFRPGLTQTRLYSHGRWVEAGDFGFGKKRNCTICVAKTKVLISFAVIAKLICAVVFAYADCWFSHAMAHMDVQSPVEVDCTLDGALRSLIPTWARLVKFPGSSRSILTQLKEFWFEQ